MKQKELLKIIGELRAEIKKLQDKIVELETRQPQVVHHHHHETNPYPYTPPSIPIPIWEKPGTICRQI